MTLVHNPGSGNLYALVLSLRKCLRFASSHLNHRYSSPLARLSEAFLSSKPIGCYMVKPHGQLVHVSYSHY